MEQPNKYNYQIKISFQYPTLGREPKFWFNWKKYKTMGSALRALKDLQKIHEKSSGGMYDNNGVLHPSFMKFKIYHYYGAAETAAQRRIQRS